MAYETFFVKNLTELKSRRGDANGRLCRVLGLNAPEEYMEVLYEWDNTSTAEDDDFEIVKPLVGISSPGRWIRRKTYYRIGYEETIDIPSLGAGSASPALPFTVTGAAVGDVVDVVPPISIITMTNFEHLLIRGYVTDANTVTVYATNNGSSGIDPVSGVFQIIIRK
jgi:hypothetical protein